MVTRTGGVWAPEYKGLSTDIKPVEDDSTKVPNGSTFFEMDTSKLFMYDNEHDVWLEV